MKISKKTSLTTCLASFILVATSSLSAQATWTGGASGSFDDLNNWSTASVPGIGSTVTIATDVAMTVDGNTSVTQAKQDNVDVWNVSSANFSLDGINSGSLADDRFRTEANHTVGTTYNFTSGSNTQDSVSVLNHGIRVNKAAQTIGFNNNTAARVLLRDIRFQADGKNATTLTHNLNFTGSTGFRVDSVRVEAGNNVGFIENTFDNVNLDFTSSSIVLEWGLRVFQNTQNADAAASILNFNVNTGTLQLLSGDLLDGGTGGIPGLAALNIGANGSVTFADDSQVDNLGGSGSVDMGGAISIDASNFAGGNLQVVNWTEGVTSIAFDNLTNADFAGFESTTPWTGIATSISLDGATGYLIKSGTNSGYLSISSVPEPETYVLFMGLLTLGFVIYRRRS